MNEEVPNPMHVAFGGLSLLCALASRPDAGDQMLEDLFHRWASSAVQDLMHQRGCTQEQALACLKDLVANVEEAVPEVVRVLRSRMAKIP
jgi:hypothetical protein